ncbi:MAG TPA: pyridoxamine 5'-phosphate oxidase family protein [Agriterribacter sp.]|nr:pyridoxamine 5'-phosphate oxidase family protein [Agriterribacter sp.]
MIGTLSLHETEEVLRQQVVGRIGCHADDTTYIVPISFVYDDDNIYCHSKEGMKINLMRKNPKVCFQVENMQNMDHWQSVIAWGEFEELTSTDSRNSALKKLIDRVLPLISSETTHLSPHWPFPPDDMSSIKGIVFRIKLNKKTGRFENHPQSADYKAC